MLYRRCYDVKLVAAYSNFFESYFVINVLWGLYQDNICEVWVVAGVDESYRSLRLDLYRGITPSNNRLIDQSVCVRLRITGVLVTQDPQTSGFFDLDFAQFSE